MLNQSWVYRKLVGATTLHVVVVSTLGGTWLLLHLSYGWLSVVI